MTPRLAIFDDGRGRFGPLTDRRAVFSIRTGAVSSRVRLEVLLGLMARDLIVEPRLADSYKATETDTWVNEPLDRKASVSFSAQNPGGDWSQVTVGADTSVLLVNGRWCGGPQEDVSRVRNLALGRALKQADGQLIAAHGSLAQIQEVLDQGFSELPEDISAQWLQSDVLIERPWHVLDRLECMMAIDLALYPQRISTTATIHESAVIVEDQGPVVVDECAVVGPLAVLEGPCFVGRHCVVHPQARIRPNVALGPFCRVGGEVSSSVLFGRSNKAHEGYLGHALVGEWCNLGAGTTVSNLKNTYGTVRVRLHPDEEPESTERAFCGPVIGDFVRTAIGSRIPTGAVIGTGTSVVVGGFAPAFAGRFRFITDAGDKSYDLDRFLDTARTAMARRDVHMTPQDEKVLRDLFQQDA